MLERQPVGTFTNLVEHWTVLSWLTSFSTRPVNACVTHADTLFVPNKGNVILPTAHGRVDSICGGVRRRFHAWRVYHGSDVRASAL